MITRCVPVLVTLVLVSAVSLSTASAEPPEAATTLQNAAGDEVGTATFSQTAAGVRIQVDVHNIDPGTHGIHIHAVGSCTPPFTSAGGHFNPTMAQHGFQNPQGPHAGDLPNLQVNANRAGHLDYTNARLTLEAGPTSLFDADGSALVIHLGPDDERTDPAGNSGDRIACGVISR